MFSTDSRRSAQILSGGETVDFSDPASPVFAIYNGELPKF
jgi:hypothetical protein